MMKFVRIGKKKAIIISIAIVVLIAGAAILYFLVLDRDTNATTEEPEQKYYSQLTGNEVTKEISELPILGVMIENSEAARPQAGLDDAGIVFEAVTEGGITRYLALYQEEQPEIVGPVRSVRSHFVDWLMGFDATVAHVGGSEEALRLLDERGAKSMNQFTYPEPYFRDETRVAPHNMYARTSDLRSLQNDSDYKTSEFSEIPRSDEAPNPQPQAPSVEIGFSTSEFQVEFRYDPETNLYTRYLGGVPHVDAVTNQPITVNNLIVIKADPVANGVQTIGTGEALLFKDGNVQEVRWQKNNFDERIRIVGTEGGEVGINRGQTWVAAIAKDRPVVY